MCATVSSTNSSDGSDYEMSGLVDAKGALRMGSSL